MSRRKTWFAIAATAALSAVALFAVATGLHGPRHASAADPATDTGVLFTMQTVVSAYNRGDAGALLPRFTDKGFREFFDVTKEEALQDPEFFGIEVRLLAVRNIVATATGATATVDIAIGLGKEVDNLTFLFQNNVWLIDGSTPGTPVIAPATRRVDMRLQEFAFVFDRAAVSGGDFALNVTNVGRQDHEIVLFKTPATVTTSSLLELLMSDEEMSGPPPFEDFGFLGIFEPGESGTSALAQPLQNGKYFFICFIPDVDGVPHAAKGMISEFTVGPVTAAPAATPGTGTAITPPSTGDAGLAEDAAPYAFVALVMLIGITTLAMLRYVHARS